MLPHRDREELDDVEGRADVPVDLLREDPGAASAVAGRGAGIAKVRSVSVVR